MVYSGGGFHIILYVIFLNDIYIYTYGLTGARSLVSIMHKCSSTIVAIIIIILHMHVHMGHTVFVGTSAGMGSPCRTACMFAMAICVIFVRV